MTIPAIPILLTTATGKYIYINGTLIVRAEYYPNVVHLVKVELTNGDSVLVKESASEIYRQIFEQIHNPKPV